MLYLCRFIKGGVMCDGCGACSEYYCTKNCCQREYTMMKKVTNASGRRRGEKAKSKSQKCYEEVVLTNDGIAHDFFILETQFMEQLTQVWEPTRKGGRWKTETLRKSGLKPEFELMHEVQRDGESYELYSIIYHSPGHFVTKARRWTNSGLRIQSVSSYSSGSQIKMVRRSSRTKESNITEI